MARLTKFTIGQRVRVARWGGPLFWKAGVVVSLQVKKSAWVDMEDPLPAGLLSFPLDDPFERSKFVVLWPGDCVQA